jgi:hypothetical protein
MLKHLQNVFKDDNKNMFSSLGQGKQFKFMQNQAMNRGGNIIEGLENADETKQPGLLDTLDKEEMDKIDELTGDSSAYQKLLSDCASSVKLYNDELAKGKPDIATMEALRETMKETCAMMDSSIQQFRRDVGTLEDQKNSLDTNRSGNSALHMDKNLLNLKNWEGKLGNMTSSDDTLDGEIENNKLRTNAIYIKYFTWMFASVTMTSIVIHQLLKD